MNIKVDTTQFQRAAEDLFKQSSRSMRDFVNGQLLGLSAQALNQTVIADKVKIQRQLGQLKTEAEVGQYYTTSKSRVGGFVKVKKSDWQRMEGSVAARIINAKLKKSGKTMIWGKKLAEAANKLIGNRLRSLAFIRSGWAPSIRMLSGVVSSKKPKVERVRKFGVDKGYAKVAPYSLSGVISGEIANTALVSGGKFANGPSNPSPIAAKALERAIRLQTNDMATELARRLKVEFSKVSAK